ncbi:MAG: type II toxin-antitoxin system Phd/YefM family antitoxin [Rhodovibrionaceae bacterium]|nr:type II toxin-antitoxin system Phd/YefM family antitoxin [Rhodovibrionaceae bacterium]
MITFSASEAGKHFGEVREKALVQPVGIERRGKINVVVLSADEYERLKALDTRRALAASEIPDADIERLRDSQMDERHAHLDRLMDDE